MSKFTEGELKVMRILWRQGELKPADIQKEFPEPIKNPALRSYLAILLDKGHVTRRLVGKAFLYTATTKPNSAFQTMCQQLAETFFNGSKEAMLQHMIGEEKFSKKELLRLRKLAKRETGETTT
jgi:predicted transcriptional regulator